MSFWELLTVAIHQLWSCKVRTFLTTLGILIGVGSVVGVVSLGRGLRNTVMGELDRLGGSRMILVENPDEFILEGGRWVRSPWDDMLVTEDLERIRNESTYAATVLPIVAGQGRLSYGEVDTEAKILGTDPNHSEALAWEVEQGRFLGTGDIRDRARVCVLGYTKAKELFPPGVDPVGKWLRLNEERYRVIGVMKDKILFEEDWGRQVVIPFTTHQTRNLGSKRLHVIMVYARTIQDTPLVIAEVRSILRRYHPHGDKFRVRDMGEDVQKSEQVFFVLTAVIGGIAGISLLVGGIGVMNIMLVSVTERTREIGIRKAIGARPGHILTQFLVEAVALSVFGGLLGLLLGFGIGKGGAYAITRMGTREFTSIVSVDAVLLALGFSAAVGIFFGVYPALRASRLDPVEALRYQ